MSTVIDVDTECISYEYTAALTMQRRKTCLHKVRYSDGKIKSHTKEEIADLVADTALYTDHFKVTEPATLDPTLPETVEPTPEPASSYCTIC
jgi:hypothetical protein